MRFSFGKIACSLFICSCLLGCGQVKEAVLLALDDDNDDVSAAQTEEAGSCGGETANSAGGGCGAGNSGGCGSTAAGAADGSANAPDVYAGSGANPAQARQLAANQGAAPGMNAGGSTFALTDQATNMEVEYYNLPAGWQGTGRVLRNPMQNLYWQSYFMHPQTGSVGFRFFSVTTHGTGPYRNSPILRNDMLATSILQDVQTCMNMPLQNIKVVSSGFTPHDTPENREIIQYLKSQSAAGIETTYAPLQYHAVVSMNCNGQPYKADIISNLLCYEQSVAKAMVRSSAPRIMLHHVNVQNSYGVVAPASQLQQEKKSVLAILASRRDNQQWAQYGLQYNSQQAQQQNAHMDRMNQIVQDKNNHISNIQQQMQQSNAATMDRVRQGQHEMITETTDIANPLSPGTAVTTDNNFNHAWTNSQGQVINTDSTLYNPNSDQDLNGVEWTQIK